MKENRACIWIGSPESNVRNVQFNVDEPRQPWYCAKVTLTSFFVSLQLAHRKHVSHCQCFSSSAEVRNLPFLRHVKWPRVEQLTQTTNRPFFMSLRVHTMQPFPSSVGGGGATVTVAPTVLRRCSIFFVTTGNGWVADASFFASLVRGIFFGLTSISAADQDFRFATRAVSDGSKTTFAFRTRPLRPTATVPDASLDDCDWTGDSSDTPQNDLRAGTPFDSAWSLSSFISILIALWLLLSIVGDDFLLGELIITDKWNKWGKQRIIWIYLTRLSMCPISQSFSTF